MFQTFLLSICCWNISYLQACLKKHLTITILLILLSALLKPLPWSKLPPSSFQLNTPAEQRFQSSAFSPCPGCPYGLLVHNIVWALGRYSWEYSVLSISAFLRPNYNGYCCWKRILTFCGFSPNFLSNLGRCWSCPRTWCRTGGGWCPCSSCSTTWGRWPRCRATRGRRGSEWKPLCHSRPPFWAKASSVKPNFLLTVELLDKGLLPLKALKLTWEKIFETKPCLCFFSRSLRYW